MDSFSSSFFSANLDSNKMKSINFLPRLASPSSRLPLLLAFLLCVVSASSPCTPLNVTFRQPNAEIPTPSLSFTTSESCSGTVKVTIEGEVITSDLNGSSLRESNSLYEHLLLLQVNNSTLLDPTTNQQCAGTGDNK